MKELIDRYMIASVDSTLLPNEVVIETDYESGVLKDSLFELVRKYLQILNLKYVMVFSGNKSIHFHVFFKNYNPLELRKIKENFYNYLREKIPGLDSFGFKENHPYRLPGSMHPETMKKASILVDEYSSRYIENGFVVESEVPKVLLEWKKGRTNETIPLLPDSGKGRGKLRQLYKELLNVTVNDGRDRVLMILVTIAKFLRIPPPQFAKDLERWARLNGWKEYRWRNWIKYYEEGRYSWMKNWRWAIKEFLTAKDIEPESYNKVKNIILAKLPWAEKYIK
ncbi:MAG: hypothetical protein DSY42_03050 [Aquifex sp.]|nr:MAG: hypothetical protein DSY42_03050 [Aquifex sp.]